MAALPVRGIKMASRLYRASLRLYPPGFRRRFGDEMSAVFDEALVEKSVEGRFPAAQFLLKEMTDAPASILRQRLAEMGYAPRLNAANLLAFPLACLLIGLLGEWKDVFTLGDVHGWLFLGGAALAGDVSGLGIAGRAAPNHRTLCAACGTLGFLLINPLGAQILHALFPLAPLASLFVGTFLLFPFLYPLFVGSAIGLLLGIQRGRLGLVFRWVGLGLLAIGVCFFANRLAAALLQSYVVRSPTQDLQTTGLAGLLAFVVAPDLLDGLLLGMLFGGNPFRRTAR